MGGLLSLRSPTLPQRHGVSQRAYGHLLREVDGTALRTLRLEAKDTLPQASSKAVRQPEPARSFLSPW